MDFDEWSRKAWNDHADDASGVAARLATEGSNAVGNDAQLVRLAYLSQHVLGEHLARWDEGIALMQALRSHRHFATDGEAAKSLRLYEAVLALGAGRPGLANALSGSDRVRAQALAAGSLAGHDTARALALFQQALAEAERSALPDSGPHTRTLAVAGNGLACTLEEKPERTADELELMILAAQTARHCWALAGGWLETERAEYRLAQTWLKAGDPEQAREHALKCLEIVEANGAVPLERFFGWEALGLAEHAAGDASAHAQAVARAHEAFAALEEGDRGWCRASLDKLEAA